MKSYIVVYRAGNSLQRLAVEKTIKSFPRWARVLEDYWFVKSDKSANEIYNMINPLVGFNGRVIVVAVKRNAAFNNLSTSDFLYEHI